MKTIVYIMILSLAFPLAVFAHPGRTDKYGCHTNRKTGEYHCHNKKRKSRAKYNYTRHNAQNKESQKETRLHARQNARYTARVLFDDKDCADFNTWWEAQEFYIKNGGPEFDPHRLDADKDGIACEHLM